MNEGKYGQVFSDAADVVLDRIGAGQSYIDAGHSYFTVEATIRFLSEIKCGEQLSMISRVSTAEGKKLRLEHELCDASGREVLATCTQLLIHVDLETRKSSVPGPAIFEQIARQFA